METSILWFVVLLLLTVLAAAAGLGFFSRRSQSEAKPNRWANYRFGWDYLREAQQRDDSDPVYKPSPDALKAAGELENADLTKTPGYPEMYDQGHLGSCTANAVPFLCHLLLVFLKLVVFEPARLFTYYWTRFMRGTVGWDSGATIKETVMALVSYGFCHEALWPYDVSKFKEEPPAAANADGKKNKVLEYKKVKQDLNDLKACLAEGHAIAFGFMVYSSFVSDEVKKTGVVPLPKPGERLLGGHAVAIVGFDEKRKMFLVRNSWGKDWGPLGGHFWMPYDFIMNSKWASDFWVITLVSVDESK
jgi:hypothetical protein